ncbi:MAG: META domain-containing protein [Lentisphaeria bacterium]|nr:META domain-containing protein [Lentisphaeria bacterium]
MKITKLGIVSAAIGAIAFIGGCASDAPLKETVWTPVKIENQGSVGLVQQQPVWFSISEEDKVSGNAGVNLIMGSVSAADEGKLVFNPLATTRMAGPNLPYESIFLEALRDSRTYKIMDETLQVYDGNGKLLATFTVGPESLKKVEKK